MPKTMIIDDSSFLKGVLKFILEQGGHSVVGMTDGYQEALEMYRTQKPDVVFCELLLGGLDGLQLVKEIKEIDSQARIVTVCMGGNETRAEEARVLGAVAHVEKPYSVVSVAHAIDVALKRR